MRRSSLALLALALAGPADACGPVRRLAARSGVRQSAYYAPAPACYAPAPAAAFRPAFAPPPAAQAVQAASYTTAPWPGPAAPAGATLPAGAFIPAVAVPTCGPAGCPQ